MINIFNNNKDLIFATYKDVFINSNKFNLDSKKNNDKINQNLIH